MLLDLPIFAGETHEDIDKHGNQYPEYFEDESDEEKEDYTIKDTDALIISGKIVTINDQYIILLGKK